jgi:hypothetical protein
MAAMSPWTLYVETSVWGSVASRQPRDRKHAVQRLLRLLDGVRGAPMIPRAVLIEIEAAPPEYSIPIAETIKSLKPEVLPITSEVEALARAYIEAGVLPERRETDAQHVAVATCFQFDYLVSWNHRHITRPMKRLQYESVNRLHGYFKSPLICNPFEACDELRH